jgi:hypothetical protein
MLQKLKSPDNRNLNYIFDNNQSSNSSSISGSRSGSGNDSCSVSSLSREMSVELQTPLAKNDSQHPTRQETKNKTCEITMLSCSSIAEIRKKAIEKAKLKTDEELGLKSSNISIHDMTNFKYLDSIKTIKNFKINDDLFSRTNNTNVNKSSNNISLTPTQTVTKDDSRLNLETPLKTKDNNSKLIRSPSCSNFSKNSTAISCPNNNKGECLYPGSKSLSYHSLSRMNQKNDNVYSNSIYNDKDELNQILMKKKFRRIEDEIEKCKIKVEEMINLPQSDKSCLTIEIENKIMERMVDLIDEKASLFEQFIKITKK